MADQERLLHVDEEGQYKDRNSEDDWVDEEVPGPDGKSSFGWKTMLFVILVATICMASLGYILSDWALYMPTTTSVETHEEVPSISMDMGMGSEANVDDAPPIVSSAEIPIPVATPTLEDVSTSAPTATPTPQLPVPNDQDKYILSNNWDYQAPPQRREYFWTVADKEYNPDGVYRPMILINEEYPGPMIEVNEGDTIVVHVDNQGINATAIHWHGMYQNGTNHMDGTVGITQCAIAPGSKFTYEFKVDGQSGTYWYHGHQGVQSADGLYGPLIIHSKDERQLQQLEYHTDRVVMLTDHYWDLSSELLLEYMKSDAENAEPVPMSALINGRGMRDCSNVGGRKCDNSTSNVGMLPFSLERGKNHRLRIINTGAFAEFQLSIDEHEFAITEVDGVDVSPIWFHRMLINPAQRYSMILTNNFAPGEAFWFRAKMISDCFAEPNEYLQTETWAPVQWQSMGGGENIAIPMSNDFPEAITQICKDLDTTKLKPVIPMVAPEPTVSLYFRVNFEIGGWQLSRGKFNQSSFQADVQHPTLFRTIDGYNDENEAFIGHSSLESPKPAFINSDAFDIEREMVLQTEGIQIIDIMLQNFDDGNHPLHLHGYKFFVMAQGHGYPPDNITDTLDVSNPLRRDTASVEAFGWTLIRLIADNPGVWGESSSLLYSLCQTLLMNIQHFTATLAGTLKQAS